jgi:diaminopropionate ammonia-lyase
MSRFAFKPFVPLPSPAASRLVARQAPRAVEPVPAPTESPLAFHRTLPGYRETPLLSFPDLAARLGFKSLRAKDESHRLGLPSFKVLGASWAVFQTLRQLLPDALLAGTPLEEMRAAFSTLAPLTLVAATDGNHGRALARVAAMFGLSSHILVPADMARARIAAIEEEDATVAVIDGSYDEAVEAAAALADDRNLVIADTAWPGYAQVPEWISEGYSTIFTEVDRALERDGKPQPDLVVVQIGVGALARGVIAHYRRPGRARSPIILAVEPITADCVLQSLVAGEPAYVPGPHPSVMAGLNAGRVSTVALPVLVGGLDAAIAITDEPARAAVRMLAEHDVVAGETGAAGLGALLLEPDLALDGAAPPEHVLVLITESATDPVSYAAALACQDGVGS